MVTLYVKVKRFTFNRCGLILVLVLAHGGGGCFYGFSVLFIVLLFTFIENGNLARFFLFKIFL